MDTVDIMNSDGILRMAELPDKHNNKFSRKKREIKEKGVEFDANLRRACPPRTDCAGHG